MRKKNREVTDISEIIDIMRKCDVCRICLNVESGYPYIVPLNFGLHVDKDEITLIFHGANESHKLDLIAKDNRASFEMDCGHKLQYFEEKGYCTMSYESVMGRGHIRMYTGDEKMDALAKIMDQYYPGKNLYFNSDAAERTAIYALKVEEITGKRKLPK